MKFFNDKTPGQMVWDDKRKKSLCRFENGEIETTDANIIKKLKEMGYRSEGTAPKAKATPKAKASASINVKNMTFAQLSAKAKELGIYIPENAAKPEILKAVIQKLAGE